MDDGAVKLDVGVEVELGNIRPEIVHVFRKRDMIWAIQRQAVVGKGCQLLAADQLGILVGSIAKRASDIRLAENYGQSWAICLSDRWLETHASNRQVSIDCSGVEASSKVLRATRPPGL